MHLSINNEEHLTSPSLEQLEQALSRLGADEFLVLSRDCEDGDQNLRAFVDVEGQWELAYQDGGDLFGAVSDVTREQAVAAFLEYAVGRDQWREEFEWEEVPPSTDLTMLVITSPDELEEGAELNWEGAVELPCIGLGHLARLFQTLCGGGFEERLDEFTMLEATSSEEFDPILVLLAPEVFQDALNTITDEQIGERARQWMETEEFPTNLVAEEEAEEFLRDIIALAREGVATGQTLVAFYTQV